MNELQIFENPEFGAVRAVELDGEPWFVAADVCRALEISNTTDALTRLDDDEKSRLNLGLSGGVTNCVNEPGLYSLVLGSRKPEAKAFKRWITHEVIPSIRKNGGYIKGQENMSDEELMAKALMVAQKKIEDQKAHLAAATEEIRIMRPKALFADSVAASKNSILVGEMAKMLKQNGVEIGQNRFFEWLRNNGFLIRRRGTDYNMPTQRSMELGLFKIKETSISHADGHISISRTPKITGKGQLYFVQRFLEQEKLDTENLGA